MAGVLIATALGATAATATTIGAGVAAAGAIYGAGSSFAGAAKAKKKEKGAKQAAAKAMAEAKKRLDVNVMEQLSIQKEPYELARDASLVAGTQALQAGVEGEERGVAATAGRVFMGQQDAQAQIRSAMGQELSDINRAVVAEEGRLKDMGMGLALEEVAGAQQAAADAAEARAQYIQSGTSAMTDLAALGLEAAPLYGAPQGGMTRQERRQTRQLGAPARNIAAQSEGVGDVLSALDQYNMPQQRQLGDSIFDSVGGLGPAAQEARGLGMGGRRTPEQLAALRQQLANDPNFFYKYP